MNRLGSVSMKTVVIAIAVLIVLGGFVLALLPLGENPAGNAGLSFAPFNNSSGYINAGPSNSAAAQYAVTTSGGGYPSTTVIQKSTTTSNPSAAQSSNITGGGGGTMIEFSSDITMMSGTPSVLASKIVDLAYSVGGYVAYQSTFSDSANVVIRVPANSYQSVISSIKGLGNVTGLTSHSNDVTVQYIDMNATLKSLIAEQEALLRLVNQSTSVNATLAIEAQLQQVNAQINSVQSEMLQTQRLVDYSTISVSISEEAPKAKSLSMVLSITPKSGVSPLSVTVNAVMTGGVGQDLVIFNFGDGTSAQGQLAVHTFVGAGDYNISADATDQNGSSVSKWAMVHVNAAPSQPAFGDFPATVVGLFVRVVEGIAEAAVVIIPLALVAAVVLVPVRRWTRGQKAIKQSQ